MLFKTTVNWLFNDICYLVIDSFNGKIGAFQQTKSLKRDSNTGVFL